MASKQPNALEQISAPAPTKGAYETTLIFRPDGAEDVSKTLLEKLKSIITAHNGETLTVETWGRRKMAYPIEKESKGYYVYLRYTGNNDLVAELERNLRLTETVMRFLTIRLEKDFNATTERKPTVNANGFPEEREERSFDRGGYERRYDRGDRGEYRQDYRSERTDRNETRAE